MHVAPFNLTAWAKDNPVISRILTVIVVDKVASQLLQRRPPLRHPRIIPILPCICLSTSAEYMAPWTEMVNSSAKGVVVGKWAQREAWPRRHQRPTIPLPYRGYSSNRDRGSVLWSVALYGYLLDRSVLCLGEEQLWTVRQPGSCGF